MSSHSCRMLTRRIGESELGTRLPAFAPSPTEKPGLWTRTTGLYFCRSPLQWRRNDSFRKPRPTAKGP